jgi:hypothetical protein
MPAISHDRRYLAPYDVAAGILLFVLAIDIALTYGSYGFTTDEAVDHLKAVRVVEFLASFGGNRDEISKVDEINIYGAMPDVLALLLQKLVPSLSFDSRHLVSAMFGAIGVYYLYRLGRAFISPAAGFFGALFLACNPMWFGYMFFNAKDIPFAATLLAALYYCLSALTGRDESGWIWLKAGLSTGLFASTKLIAVPILGAIGLASLACLIFVPATASVQIDRVFFRRLAKLAVSATFGCLLCFAAFWPQFFLFGPAQLVRIVRLFMNYEPWQGIVQIHGDYIPFDKVPWYYTSTYIAISMPLFLLPLIAVGSVLGIFERQPFVIASAIICIGFLAFQAISDARALDGYRHFIFLVPFLMLIAAYPIGWLFSHYPSRVVRLATPAAVLIAMMPALVSTYQLFPYQYSFYNGLVGGVPGADGRYYIDPWRSALREALRKVEDLHDTRDIVDVYHSCGSTLNFADHPRFKPVERPEDADYIILLRRNCDPRQSPTLDFPAVGEVRRQGVLFAAVYNRQNM